MASEGVALPAPVALLHALGDADRAVAGAARHAAEPPPVARAVRGFSLLGEHGALWIALGLAGMAADPRRRAAWRRGVRLVVAAYGLNQALKALLRRRRPRAPGGLDPLVRTQSDL